MTTMTMAPPANAMMNNLMNMMGSNSMTAILPNVPIHNTMEELHQQIMMNIFHQLDLICNHPVNNVNQLITSYHLNMLNNDRDMIYRNMYTILNGGNMMNNNDDVCNHEISMVYDDGTLYGMILSNDYDNGYMIGQYREPGNSGYSILTSNEYEANYKHWTSCIDSYSGEPMNCLVSDTASNDNENTTGNTTTATSSSFSYVHCVNDCELIPCNNDDLNNVDDETTNMPSLCRHYEVIQQQQPLPQQLGYIPTTDLCLNGYAQPEQQFGSVMMMKMMKENITVLIGNDTIIHDHNNPDHHIIQQQQTNMMTFGDCLYNDGITIVNRTINGAYAQCGDEDCNTTFIGGKRSYEYDPRASDPMYIQVKKHQKSDWSKPYMNNKTNTLQMKYYQPFYSLNTGTSASAAVADTTIFVTTTTTSSIQSNSYNGTNQMIFEGIISSGFDMNMIGQYLQQKFMNGSTKVFIVEYDEPNYILGTSSSGDNNIMKSVLRSNQSIPCTVQDNIDKNNTCIDIRIPILEYDDDPVLSQAFLEHKKRNFPCSNTTLGYLPVKANDVIGSKAYVAFHHTYKNFWSDYDNTDQIKWHIFVLLPMEQSTTDSILKGNIMFAVICVIATIGFITCFSMLLRFYSKRTEKAIIQSDWRFTSAFLLGCSVINISSYTLLGPNTDQLCMLRMWSFNGLFVCALSPLFVKVWRMCKLLNASIGFRRAHVTNCQAWLYTLPLVIIEILLLSIVSIVDPPKQTEELGDNVGEESIGQQVITCQHSSNAFYWTQLTFNACLIFTGCILAYKSRDLDPKYGEAKQLAFSMYNIAFTGIVTILIMNLVNLDQVNKITLQTVSVLWGSCFCSLAFVLPRLLEAQKDSKNHTKSSNSNTCGTSSYSVKEHSLCKVSGLDSESYPLSNSLKSQNVIVNGSDQSHSDNDLDTTNINSSCNSKENSTGPSVVTEPMVFITSMSEESDQEMDENDMIDI